MEFCPVCKSELKVKRTDCAVCGYETSGEEERVWVCVGSIEDKISVDFAEETLKSYEIPVVVFSKSGFFGTAGLHLNPFYSHTSGLFEVSVPQECKEEAIDILTMILGDKLIRRNAE